MLRRVFALLALLASVSALAQSPPYPSKPVRFVVPFPPGNAGDLMARLLAEKLTASLKQTVVVENRTGAGGNIGAEHVAKAPPDGHTVLIAASGIVTANPHLYKLNFDPLKDLAPVTLLYSGAPLLVVGPKVEQKSLQELVDFARKNPGKLTYASYGPGHVSHIIGEMFKQSAGIDILHVPYKNSPLPDVMSGQVDMIFESPLLVAKNTERLRPIGVVSAKRNAKLPNVPAVAEVLPGFEVTGWLGAFVPAGTPPDIVRRLHQEFAAALNAPDIRKRLDEQMLEPGGSSPDEFASYVRSASDRVGKVIRSANIKAE